MLYPEKIDTIADFGAPRQADSPAESLQKLFGFVRRQAVVILVATGIIFSLGIVYLISAPPRYTAQTTLIIDTRKVQLFQQQSILGDIPIDSASVESQIEILKSEKVALAVIAKLHLTDDPEFSGSGGGVLSSLLKLAASLSGDRLNTSDFELSRSAIKTFQSNLNIKRVGLSYVIEISFKSLNAERAAQIANAVADSYIVDQLEAKDQATRRASVWLQDRIGELRTQATIAEKAVVDFKASNNIVNTGGSGGRLVTEQQVAELNSQLVTARAQTAETKARLDRIESVIRADSPSATVNSTVTDALRSEVVTKLRSQYLDIANREADWSRRYGANHLAAVNLRNQMAEIQNSILNELRRLAETYKSDYEIAKQRESGVQSELASAITQSQATNQAQVSLKELESSSQTYRTLYDNFLQRYMESIQQQSFPISEARIISQATRPLQKSDPKAILVLGIAGIGGLILGLGLGLARDLSDNVFRSVEQVESELNVTCLAVIPCVPANEALIGFSKNKVPTHPTGPRTIARNRSIVWTASEAPFSRFAETIRSIKLAVDLFGQSRSSKIIGITSAIPGEGKSTLSVSLAQLMAHTGSRVVLVDCDLRNPALTSRIAPSAELGVVDAILGTKPLNEVLWRDAVTNMMFLPGSAADIDHPSEILASDAAAAFFEMLRKHFDYIIVDLSPLAPVVDVRATAHFIDSYILAIRWGQTKLDSVKRALKSSPAIHKNLLGAVLTQANARELQREDGYGSSYYGKAYAGK